MEVKIEQSLYQLCLLQVIFSADVFIVELMGMRQESVLYKTNVTTTLCHFTHHLACFNVRVCLVLRELTVTTTAVQHSIAE